MEVLTIECNKCAWTFSEERTRATAAQVAMAGMAAWKAHKATHASAAPLAPRHPLYVVTGGEKGETGRPYIVADASMPNALLHAERRQEASRRPIVASVAPRAAVEAQGRPQRTTAEMMADAQQELTDELQKRGLS